MDERKSVTDDQRKATIRQIKQKLGKRFTSLDDLRKRAAAGEVLAQQVCIGALSNMGCEHLASNRNNGSSKKWLSTWDWLLEVVTAHVEAGVSEDQAFEDVLAECNMARTYSDIIKPEDYL